MISSGNENQVEYNSGSNQASNFKIRLTYSGRQIWNFERNNTPWILQHGVHKKSYLLQILKSKKCFENFFCANKSVAF